MAGRRREGHPNKRSEAWVTFADLLPVLGLDRGDEDLAADLLAPRYSLDSQGRRVVEPKAETKRRLRRSPDRADAVVMAFSIDQDIGHGYRRGQGLARGRIDTRDAMRIRLERLYGHGGMRVPGSGL